MVEGPALNASLLSGSPDEQTPPKLYHGRWNDKSQTQPRFE